MKYWNQGEDRSTIDLASPDIRGRPTGDDDYNGDNYDNDDDDEDGNDAEDVGEDDDDDDGDNGDDGNDECDDNDVVIILILSPLSSKLFPSSNSYSVIFWIWKSKMLSKVKFLPGVVEFVWLYGLWDSPNIDALMKLCA